MCDEIIKNGLINLDEIVNGIEFWFTLECVRDVSMLRKQRNLLV